MAKISHPRQLDERSTMNQRLANQQTNDVGHRLISNKKTMDTKIQSASQSLWMMGRNFSGFDSQRSKQRNSNRSPPIFHPIDNDLSELPLTKILDMTDEVLYVEDEFGRTPPTSSYCTMPSSGSRHRVQSSDTFVPSLMTQERVPIRVQSLQTEKTTLFNQKAAKCKNLRNIGINSSSTKFPHFRSLIDGPGNRPPPSSIVADQKKYTLRPEGYNVQKSMPPILPTDVQSSMNERSREILVSGDGEIATYERFRPYQSGQWAQKFDELYRYRKQHGDCLVPHAYKENPSLARWVKRQRYQHKLLRKRMPSTITPERVKALESIGFVWDSQAESWGIRLKELREFRRVYKHCNVPSNFAENTQLATWVKCQRRQRKLFLQGKTSNITEDRINELEKLGFEWDLRVCNK